MALAVRAMLPRAAERAVRLACKHAVPGSRPTRPPPIATTALLCPARRWRSSWAPAAPQRHKSCCRSGAGTRCRAVPPLHKMRAAHWEWARQVQQLASSSRQD